MFIDGSNISYSVGASRPTFRNIERIRDKLVEIGLDNIAVICDASLRNKLAYEDIQRYDEAVRKKWIETLPAGVKADYQLFNLTRESLDNKEDAYILSNNRFLDIDRMGGLI